MKQEACGIFPNALPDDDKQGLKSEIMRKLRSRN